MLDSLDMEDIKKSKSVKILGGYYAKAKQRILNSVGKRTTLTRNPRVDYISHKVDEIKQKKMQVMTLAEQYKRELKAILETSSEMTHLMTDTWKEELGEREWDAEKKVYVRKLHPEEQRLVSELEEAMKKFDETLVNVEEESRVEQIAKTKEEYKLVRTEYSDAMIDLESELDGGGEAKQKTVDRVEEAKGQYEAMSERLTMDALKFESLFRDELSQRITAHFTAQMHLVRGMGNAYKDFYPFTKSLTLDWQEMRARRKADLESHRKELDDDDFRQHATAPLPAGPGIPSSRKEANPFSSMVDSPSGGGGAVLTGEASGTSSTTPRMASEDFFGLPRSGSKSAGTSSDLRLDNVQL